jgi:fluoroquinolone transport system permease protein
MFKRVVLHEFKNILRDSMYFAFVFISLLMVVVGLFLVPYLKDLGNELAANIVTIAFIMMNGFLYGAVVGFTLLDDQDDKVLFSLKITPIKVRYYVLIKLFLAYLFGFITTFLLIITTGFLEVSNFRDILFILILTPLQAPILALLVNSFANNKIEGFVVMKLSGIILIAPIAALFVNNWTELLLGLLPGFWSIRIASMQLLSTEFFINITWVYFVIGIIVNSIFLWVLFRLYTKKVNI